LHEGSLKNERVIMHRPPLALFLLSLTLGCASPPENAGGELSVSALASRQRGEERVLLILSRFSSDSDSSTDAEMRRDARLYLDHLDRYVRETSYGRMTLSSRVVGPYMLSADGCDNTDFTYATNHRKIRRDATAAADPEVDYRTVDTVIYMTADDLCMTGASGNPAWDRGIVTAEGPLITRIVHYPFWPWSRDLDPVGTTMPHEFGHTLGGIHIDALDCRARDGSRIPIAHSALDGTCTWSDWTLHEIGLDVMNGAFAHFNGPHKDKFGWLDPGEKIVTTRGRFRLTPIETAGGLKLIRVPFGGADAEYGGYALEYRQPIGMDANVPEHGVPLDGVFVTIYWSRDPGWSFISTLRPGPATGKIRLEPLPLARRDELGRLVPSFVDPRLGLAISVHSTSATGADVEIGPLATGPPCGPETCLAGQVCCNRSCGICAPPNGACPDVTCGDTE
jgi:hypothetical protein